MYVLYVRTYVSQVLAVFRSFPFRAPAAPAGNGNGAGGSLVEETQAPPPAYNTLAREPEEAGEVIAEQADPENVGENGSVQPAVSIIQSHCFRCWCRTTPC